MDTRFTSHMLCPPPYACAILYYPNKYQATVAICFGLVRSHQHDKADDKQERGLINLPRFSFFVRNCSHPYAANDCRDRFFFSKLYVTNEVTEVGNNKPFSHGMRMGKWIQ